jgi:hypothetical protein
VPRPVGNRAGWCTVLRWGLLPGDVSGVINELKDKIQGKMEGAKLFGAFSTGILSFTLGTLIDKGEARRFGARSVPDLCRGGTLTVPARLNRVGREMKNGDRTAKPRREPTAYPARVGAGEVRKFVPPTAPRPSARAPPNNSMPGLLDETERRFKAALSSSPSFCAASSPTPAVSSPICRSSRSTSGLTSSARESIFSGGMRA